MFWWYLPMESRWGAKAILSASGAMLLLLASVPFIDRTDKRWWRERPVAMVALAVILGGAMRSRFVSDEPTVRLRQRSAVASTPMRWGTTSLATPIRLSAIP